MQGAVRCMVLSVIHGAMVLSVACCLMQGTVWCLVLSVMHCSVWFVSGAVVHGGV